MNFTERIEVFCKFSIGVLLALIHVPFPFISDTLLSLLIKDLGTYTEYYESDGDESVCGKVQSENPESRGMAEGDGGTDGVPGPEDPNEFVQVGKPESDEGADE